MKFIILLKILEKYSVHTQACTIGYQPLLTDNDSKINIKTVTKT